MRRIVVLGTGTGVGKTYFTAALARALVNSGASRVLALKPIETGLGGGRRSGVPPAGSDAALLEATCTVSPPRPHPLYGLADPVSAHLAARSEGKHVSIGSIVEWLYDAEYALQDTTLHTWSLIETAGGVFSPISPRLTNLDLAKRLDPAIWILVAPDALGVLHDVRASLIAMTSLGRAPDYLVLSESRARDASVGSNAGELPRVGLPRPITVLSRGHDPVASAATLVNSLRRR